MAARFGESVASRCGQCGARDGVKLSRANLEDLARCFFVEGTIPRGTGGFVSILQLNSHDTPDDEVPMREETAADWHLIKSVLGWRLFYNGPDLWQLGITGHYDDDQQVSDATIATIVDQLAIRTIAPDMRVFRIRKNINPARVLDQQQYMAPPHSVRREFGRFDDETVNVFYTSPSLDVCIHECRVTMTDEIHAAILEPVRELKLADLTSGFAQCNSEPYDDLANFFGGLALSRNEETYRVSRRIARELARRKFVDGFISSSFYTPIHGGGLNYCFFDDPLSDGRLRILSVNRVQLEGVVYRYGFGPTFEYGGE